MKRYQFVIANPVSETMYMAAPFQALTAIMKQKVTCRVEAFGDNGLPLLVSNLSAKIDSSLPQDAVLFSRGSASSVSLTTEIQSASTIVLVGGGGVGAKGSIASLQISCFVHTGDDPDGD